MSAHQAPQPATSQEREVKLDWRKIAKAAGEHGIRYRTNTALERFLSEIAATPTPPTLSEVERLVELCDAACSNAETALNFLAEAGRPGLADTQRCYITNIRAALAQVKA